MENPQENPIITISQLIINYKQFKLNNIFMKNIIHIIDNYFDLSNTINEKITAVLIDEAKSKGIDIRFSHGVIVFFMMISKG